jgi:hypothetical protein
MEKLISTRPTEYPTSSTATSPVSTIICWTNGKRIVNVS